MSYDTGCLKHISGYINKLLHIPAQCIEIWCNHGNNYQVKKWDYVTCKKRHNKSLLLQIKFSSWAIKFNLAHLFSVFSSFQYRDLYHRDRSERKSNMCHFKHDDNTCSWIHWKNICLVESFLSVFELSVIFFWKQVKKIRLGVKQLQRTSNKITF